MTESSSIHLPPLSKTLGVFFWIGAGMIMGVGIMWVIPKAAFDGEGEIRENTSGFSFINPLLECDLGATYISGGHPKPDKETLLKIIDDAKRDQHISFASVYYRDLNNGPWMGIEEREKFLPASLLKVPVMIYFLKQAERDPSIMEQLVTFDSTPFPEEQQYFTPVHRVEPGKAYPVQELIERAIRYSDNQATQGVSSIAPPYFLENLLDTMHVDHMTDASGDFIRVRDYATFFRVLFNASYLSDVNSEAALALLSTTTFDQGLTAKLPPDIRVAHKFGEATQEHLKTKQLHDCGIVYLPGHPYVLCVMTRGTDLDAQAGVIADISKTVFDELAESD